ncbi:hypothetical protein JOF57_002266 [Mycolicibacterium lutetiense]|uniref:Uncharacterized protein n=1 Tax=Mycolicibacterium lutetiense TaxID=1641992 RepID=A0ABS4ZS71_9MYCO|nr:hypothetical protein [Mycolicibacterium lutetiense]
MATQLCVSLIRVDNVEIREGRAEETGCTDSSQDVAVSVNNVMLWDRPADVPVHADQQPPGPDGGPPVNAIHDIAAN